MDPNRNTTSPNPGNTTGGTDGDASGYGSLFGALGGAMTQFQRHYAAAFASQSAATTAATAGTVVVGGGGGGAASIVVPTPDADFQRAVLASLQENNPAASLTAPPTDEALALERALAASRAEEEARAAAALATAPVIPPLDYSSTRHDRGVAGLTPVPAGRSAVFQESAQVREAIQRSLAEERAAIASPLAPSTTRAAAEEDDLARALRLSAEEANRESTAGVDNEAPPRPPAVSAVDHVDADEALARALQESLTMSAAASHSPVPDSASTRAADGFPLFSSPAHRVADATAARAAATPEQAQRTMDRMIRAEQDREYELSLAMDRSREEDARAKAYARDLERQAAADARIRAEEAHRERLELVAFERNDRAGLFPLEDEAAVARSGAATTRVRFSFADGRRVDRVFALDSTRVGHLYVFADSLVGDDEHSYSLRTTFPVATLDDLGASLTEAGLANTMLMVVMEGTGDDGESEYSYDDDDDDDDDDSDAGGS